MFILLCSLRTDDRVPFGKLRESEYFRSPGRVGMGRGSRYDSYISMEASPLNVRDDKLERL